MSIESVIKNWESGVIDASTAMGMIASLEAEVRVGPVYWLRMLNGKPDWAEDCISENGTGILDGYSEADGYSAVPLFAAPQPEIPDGWALVPKEPTEAMEAAGWIDKEDVCPCDIYHAMLAASPPPPSVDAGKDGEGR